MKKSLILISVLSIAFNACSAEPRIVIKPCIKEAPAKPHRADFASDFDYLKSIFDYTYSLETSLESCL